MFPTEKQHLLTKVVLDSTMSFVNNHFKWFYWLVIAVLHYVLAFFLSINLQFSALKRVPVSFISIRSIICKRASGFNWTEIRCHYHYSDEPNCPIPYLSGLQLSIWPDYSWHLTQTKQFLYLISLKRVPAINSDHEWKFYLYSKESHRKLWSRCVAVNLPPHPS